MKVLKKQPSQVWTYYSPDGAPIFYVARINNADGSKAAVLPVSFDGHQWVGAAHPEPRPLYNLPELAAHPDKPVLLVEGEKTADAAKHLVSDFVVTTWSGGSGATAKTDFTPLVGRDVVLWPDNDDAGLKAMRAVADILTGARTLRGVKVPQGLEKGWDLADALPVDLDPVALIGRAIDLRKAKLASLKIISAAALQAKVFRPPRWAVPDYLPEGLAIGAGKPKTGKSWLFLGTAIGVAAGTAVFGNVKVEQGDVLAILLEDPERRVQTRMKALLQGERFPERLQIATEWRKADQGGLDDIRLWLQAHPEARLVIIDTLAKIRGKADRDKGVYADDYDVISAFKKLADEFRVAILLVHHLKKEGATDPLDAISGTAGLTGAADTLMVLKREPNDKNALLYVRGRDVNEAEVALEFDDDTGRWTRLGAGEDFRKSEERRAVLAVLREVGGLSPREIAEATNMKPGNVRVLLHKMRRNGEVNQLNGGKYEIGC
jgi:DNA-binding transcriptional ArsR family regulator